jgi:hypothetical protein
MTKILSYNLVDYAVKSQLTKADNIRGNSAQCMCEFRNLAKYCLYIFLFWPITVAALSKA